MKKLRIKDKSDLISFRNIVLYKLTGKTGLINQFIRYNVTEKTINGLSIKNLIDVNEFADAEQGIGLKYTAEMAQKNRFNLLGSGWVRYAYSEEPLGLFGIKYNDSEKRPISGLTHANGYERIPWNRDIKTGYVWDSYCLNLNCAINSPEGVDVKNVWELGRLNFLVPLALYALNTTEKQKAIRYYKASVTDFICANPVSRGVNWSCAMEPAIRISNLLISYDLIRQIDEGYCIDDSFERMMRKTVFQHIKFIWNNLEKRITKEKSGNHYYSNIAGLLVALCYVEHQDASLRSIYRAARDSFFYETESQFYKTGGHIECSSGYFRLVAEMAVFCTAMLIRNGEDIPNYIWKILESNRDFAISLKRPDGTYFSYGDCDSGRYIKTQIYGRMISNVEAERHFLNLEGYAAHYGDRELFFLEDDSSFNSLIKYTDGLIERTNMDNNALETVIIRALSGRRNTLSSRKKKTGCTVELKSQCVNVGLEVPFTRTTFINIPPYGESEWKSFLYREAGIYIFQTNRMAFFFRFGNDEAEGHAHNDTLHYEYQIDGVNYYSDCGTFTYSGFPHKRNAYRSTSAHNVPQYPYEQRKFGDLFSYLETDQRELHYISPKELTVIHYTKHYVHERHIRVGKDTIQIDDRGSIPFTLPEKLWDVVSPSYGVLEIPYQNVDGEN